MAQQLQPWRSQSGEKLWLSTLVGTMEKMSRPEVRSVPCDPFVLARLRAQLALPASAPSFSGYARRGSGYGLPN